MYAHILCSRSRVLYRSLVIDSSQTRPDLCPTSGLRAHCQAARFEAQIIGQAYDSSPVRLEHNCDSETLADVLVRETNGPR